MVETSSTTKMKIRRGDTVTVLRGKDRGKTGKIMAVFPRANRVLVEGINLVKKHVRPKRAGEKGQRVHVASTLPTANVQLICPNCKKPTRVSFTFENDAKLRQCKKCQAVIK